MLFVPSIVIVAAVPLGFAVKEFPTRSQVPSSI